MTSSSAKSSCEKISSKLKQCFQNLVIGGAKSKIKQTLFGNFSKLLGLIICSNNNCICLKKTTVIHNGIPLQGSEKKIYVFYKIKSDWKIGVSRVSGLFKKSDIKNCLDYLQFFKCTQLLFIVKHNEAFGQT